MKKLKREIARVVEREGASVVSCTNDRGHYHLVVKTPDGTQHNLVAASTPRIVDHTLKAIGRDVRRLSGR